MNNKETYIFTNNLPLITTILCLIVLYIPNSITIPQNIRPLLALSSSFFWLTHRPQSFGLISVITISIIADTISSTPFGSNLLMFFCLYTLINKFEKYFYNKPFLIYWYGFMFFSFAAIFLKWFVLSVYYTQFLPITPTFLTYLTTIFSYPIISVINIFIQSYMRQVDEQ